MKRFLKKAKRGFTLVELSIVITVLALLAAVLIPTFSGVINEAGIKTARVAAEEEISYYLAEQESFASMKGDYIVVYGGYAFLVDDGEFDSSAYDLSDGKPEKKEISLTCGKDDKSVTIKLVTNSEITSGETGISKEETAVEVNVAKDETTAAVIVVSAVIESGTDDSGVGYCKISKIKEGEGEVTRGADADYTYLHDGAAIYEIKYS